MEPQCAQAPIAYSRDPSEYSEIRIIQQITIPGRLRSLRLYRDLIAIAAARITFGMTHPRSLKQFMTFYHINSPDLKWLTEVC